MSLPSRHFPGAQSVFYEGYSYDTYGRQVWRGIYNEDHWASVTTAYYNTESGGKIAGRIKEVTTTGGSYTQYRYDFDTLSGRNLFIETKIEKSVIQPDGTSKDITTAIAYDRGTGWPRVIKSSEGYITEMGYDKLGRITSLIKPGDEPPAAAGTWTVSRQSAPRDRITYNDSSRTVTVNKDTLTGNTNGRSITEYYVYDQRNNMLRAEKYERSLYPQRTAITSFSYDKYGRVTSMTDPNGKKTTYTYDFLNRPRTVTAPDGTFVKHTYNDGWGLKTTENERGIITNERMNWNGDIEYIIADVGGMDLTTQIWYDGLGRKVAEKNPLGEVIRIWYSPFGKEKRISYPQTDVFIPPENPDGSFPSIQTVKITPETIITYNDNGFPVREQTGYEGSWRIRVYTVDALGRIIKEKNGPHESWIWYDGEGNPVQTADAEQVSRLKSGGSPSYKRTIYTSRGKPAIQIDEAGAETRYWYDRDDRPVKMTDPRAVGAEAENFTALYTYDDLGRLVQGDLPPVPGSNQRSRIYITYDLRGNALSMTGADGVVTSWTYDSRNRKLTEKMTGPDGTARIQGWIYDDCGNITAHIAGGEPSGFNPASGTGIKTRYSYDALNRITQTDYPDGQILIQRYDALGRVQSERDALGNQTRYTYNSRGLLSGTTGEIRKEQALYYNAWGELSATIHKNTQWGDQIRIQHYDDHGNLSYERTNSEQLWQYWYNPRNLLVSSADPNGTMTSLVWSDTGLLMSETKQNDGHTESRSWTYDMAGFMTGGSDGSIHTAVNRIDGSYKANAYGLITAYSTTVDGKTLAAAHQYDSGMRPLELVYPDGNTVTYQYNGLGDLTAIPGYASGGQYTRTGRLNELHAANGTKLRKNWNGQTGLLDGYDWGIPGVASRSLSWDTRGNIEKITRGENANRFSYDALNRLDRAIETGEIETSVHDFGLSRQGMKASDVGGNTVFSYGNAREEIKFDYQAMSLGYDLGLETQITRLRLEGISGRINERTVEIYISVTGAEGTWKRIKNYSVSIDETGRIYRFDEPVTARYIKVHNTWDERDASFDPVDRHTIDGPAADIVDVWFIIDEQDSSWYYDQTGNRVLETKYRRGERRIESTYYPNTNLLMTRDGWSYNYDRNGNLTERGNSGVWNGTSGSFDFDGTQGEVWKYGYDLSNRLVRVEKSRKGIQGLTEIAAYTYDVRGLRVKTVKPGGGTEYTQYDQAGNLIWKEGKAGQCRYIRAGNTLWAEERIADGATAVYYHHTDHLGTSEAVTDASGLIVWEANYEAFGSVLRTSGTMAFAASYTGKELDEDTGLYYFNARWYDSSLGKFITEDPARDGTNWYEYCRNNPLKYVDPDGLDAWEHTNEWNDEYINGYKEYVEAKIAKYQESGEKFTCEDLALGVLIDYASEKGLPVSIENGKGVHYSGDKKWKNIDKFKKEVLSTTAAKDILQNTEGINGPELRKGDIVFMGRSSANVNTSTSHIQVIITDDKTILTVKQGNLERTGRGAGKYGTNGYGGTTIQDRSHDVTNDVFYGSNNAPVEKAKDAYQMQFRRWNYKQFNQKMEEKMKKINRTNKT
ncbi:RHS domain-containing protein [Brucepastera parasyntrophica]|uniref:RHS repeat-associated core domain-containing protein n=1 Tax=Brucepastera parasyntrophica TaxID=2880008 RepID=UPI00210E6B43|nr:RHS repeat-associated core domain-containing protein [Brucepastera parasyntrophica]ULQ59742.1 RHS domain-containing protein [Brucepastera parasyntrophica]